MRPTSRRNPRFRAVAPQNSPGIRKIWQNTNLPHGRIAKQHKNIFLLLATGTQFI
jgi:hypothetical protein